MNNILKLTVITSSIILSAIFTSASWASVLQEIKNTGVLKVGIRKDSMLFGFEDSRGNWTGYCATFANSLANSLSRQLNTPVSVQGVLSTLQNRESIVRNGIAHIECGPNTISREKEVERNIKYSSAFFVTGTQLIVRAGNANANLSNGQLGVFQGSTNLRAVTQAFPNANIQQFAQRSQGVSAVRNGQITAFAGDSILIIGEAVRQGWAAKDFEILPKKPLSCDLYGMILPANDLQWENTVNSFIRSSQGLEVWRTWFEELAPYLKGTLDYCRSR
ncbi:Putative dienelactone hydrolase [Planktothrix tepida]|uniref:Dienelactone hydrolase n=1 Tax=Planktothrix tepida PCC 9214 TaxID=671072 RepID=A0A1J1LL30_9CYAN